jgi:hypothetical protein
MKNLYQLTNSILLGVTLAGNSAATITDSSFSSHHVSDIYAGQVVKPRLRTEKDKEFASQLRNAARQKVNFAGHFVLATWGCGASCLMGAIIDAQSGHVTWLPFTICCGDYRQSAPIEFRADSTLLVFRGMRDELEPAGIYSYVYERGGLKLIATQVPASN